MFTHHSDLRCQMMIFQVVYERWARSSYQRRLPAAGKLFMPVLVGILCLGSGMTHRPVPEMFPGRGRKPRRDNRYCG